MDLLKKYMAMAIRAVQQMLTGRDNLTVDVARVGIFAALAALIGYAGYDLLALHHAFDPATYGVGVATVLGGGGASIALKRKDEPSAD